MSTTENKPDRAEVIRGLKDLTWLFEKDLDLKDASNTPFILKIFQDAISLLTQQREDEKRLVQVISELKSTAHSFDGALSSYARDLLDLVGWEDPAPAAYTEKGEA